MIRCGKHHSKNFTVSKFVVYIYTTERQPLNKMLTTKVADKGNKVVTGTWAQGDSRSM